MPFFATSSRLGVRPFFEPRNPMRSARVVSSVIRMMLGRWEAATGGCLLAGVAATAEESRKRTGTTSRRDRIGNKKGVYHRQTPRISWRSLENELDRKVHVPRSALSDDRV